MLSRHDIEAPRWSAAGMDAACGAAGTDMENAMDTLSRTPSACGRARRFVLALLLAAVFAFGVSAPTDSAAAGASKLKVAFADAAWNGKRIPKGQQCSKFGGKGGTPPLEVKGAPDGTVEIVVAYNDRSYQPLSFNGGHGKIGYEAGPGTTIIPALPGETARMPEGARVVAKNRATGGYARPGYLPPCSGGRGNLYFADVFAVSAKGKMLAKGRIVLGRY